MRRCTYVGALHAAARPPHAQRYSYLRGDGDVDGDVDVDMDVDGDIDIDIEYGDGY